MYDELMSLTCMYVVILDLNIFYPCLRFVVFFKSRQKKQVNSRILRDKTMDNTLMYIPHDKQYYPLCRLQVLVEMFGLYKFKNNQSKSKKGQQFLSQQIR